jgi:lipoprotein-anchoring transpeptidase ErfK/SrfK
MRTSTIILGAVLCVVTVVTLVSFVALKKISMDIQRTVRHENDELFFGHLKDIVSTGDIDRAETIVAELMGEYPGSDRTVDAIEYIGGIFDERGNDRKALYYYRIIVNKYPEQADSRGIKEKAEKINSQFLNDVKFSDSDTIEYIVQPGDSLFSIARKYNTTIYYIQDLNGLKNDLIMAGQKLRISTAEFSLYVDKYENIMVLYKNGEPFKTYSIATGKNNSTPEGVFKIVDKMIKPPWTRPDGKIIQPGDPEYELGERWMPISEPGYGIHGTNNEDSIGKQATLGCVRMHNSDVIELYGIVPRGTRVEIVDTAKKEKAKEPGPVKTAVPDSSSANVTNG